MCLARSLRHIHEMLFPGRHDHLTLFLHQLLPRHYYCLLARVELSHSLLEFCLELLGLLPVRLLLLLRQSFELLAHDAKRTPILGLVCPDENGIRWFTWHEILSLFFDFPDVLLGFQSHEIGHLLAVLLCASEDHHLCLPCLLPLRCSILVHLLLFLTKVLPGLRQECRHVCPLHVLQLLFVLLALFSSEGLISILWLQRSLLLMLLDHLLLGFDIKKSLELLAKFSEAHGLPVLRKSFVKLGFLDVILRLHLVLLFLGNLFPFRIDCFKHRF
mmetsp:Transcript_110528/g.195719  ORF Transcript_110528/g.195719 Transcript_110528/m.195719 type:complete len:273 (+) Transcript_110528:2455-3273(+)